MLIFECIRNISKMFYDDFTIQLVNEKILKMFMSYDLRSHVHIRSKYFWTRPSYHDVWDHTTKFFKLLEFLWKLKELLKWQQFVTVFSKMLRVLYGLMTKARFIALGYHHYLFIIFWNKNIKANAFRGFLWKCNDG